MRLPPSTLIAVGLGAATGLLAPGIEGVAAAAAVRLRAADACVEVDSIIEEAEAVIGRPLASVPGVTFEVEIDRAGPRSWRMRLRTTDDGDPAPPVEGRRNGPTSGKAAPAEARRPAPAPPPAREIKGATCAEVARAAAVGIAIAVQGGAAKQDDAAARSPGGEPEPRAAASSGPAPPEGTVQAVAAPARAGELDVRPTVTLLAVGDGGSLPHVGVGGELDLGVELGRWRALGLLSAFAPQETSAGAGTGGRFTLLFGGLAACAAPGLARARVLACLGGEIGRLSGEGTGATRPRLGDAWWAAGRAEVGLSVPMAERWALALRGGVTVPFVRPTFEVNGTIRVHQPSALAGRLAAGVELAF